MNVTATQRYHLFNSSSYLQRPEQLAAVLYPGNVKQLIDGSVGQLRAKFRVSFDGI